MKRLRLLTIVMLTLSMNGMAQKPASHDCSNTLPGTSCQLNSGMEYRDGNGTLGQSYNQTACGLNYVATSVMTTTRYTSSPGTGLPVNMTIAGIPPCAVIQNSFVYWGGGGTGVDPSLTVNGTPFTGTMIGSHIDKCWGMGGTENFRADAAAVITGNGTYTIDVGMGANACDGISIIVIYVDPAAAYEGTIILDDGCIVNNSGSTENWTMTGLSVCANSSFGEAFVICSDMQNNLTPPTHTGVMNGVAGTYNNNFWNFNLANTPYTGGQTTSAFSLTPDSGSDCYNWVLAGAYYQTTTCTVCTSGGMTLTTTSTDATCGNCNGTATVTASGGASPYTYSWDDPLAQTTATATGLCPGTYTVTVTDASGCMTGTASVTINNVGAITATEAWTDETCQGDNDGTITLTGSGGTSPYTYDIGFGPTNTTGTFTGLPPGTYNYTVTDAAGCVTTGTIVIAAGPVCCPMTNTVASTNATCNAACDGTITLTESMGTAPVTFSIDGGVTTQATGNFTGLCAGTYNILIEDAGGCQYIDVVTITEPTAVTGTNTAQTNASCNGACDGSVTIAGGGGTPGYTYDIGSGAQASGTFTGLCAGTYTVTVIDNNGCTGTISVTITEPTAVTGSVNSTMDATCGSCNGSVDLGAAGGTPGYTFDIGSGPQASGVFTGLCAGTYTATIIDNNGCTTTVPFTINDLSGLTASITAQTDVDCNGACNGSVTVTAGGSTSPYTYDIGGGPQASGTFTGLCAGSYTVTVTDFNGCTFPVAVTITEPPVMTSGVTGVDATCNAGCDGSIDLTVGGGVTPYSYAWTGPGGPYTTEDLTGLCAGTYDVTATDANGCTVTETYVINEPTAIVLTTSMTSSNCGQSDGSVSVTATGGTVAVDYTYSWEDATSTVVGTTATVTGLPGGTYTITVTDDNGCTATATETITDIGGGTVTAAVTSNYNGADVSCNGACDGEVTATATGGSSPYTYDLSGTINTTGIFPGLCAGTYTINVTDAVGCLSSTTVTVTEPTAVSGTAVVVDEVCVGDCQGSIDITASGGTGPYTYSFDNGVTYGAANMMNALCAGGYDLSVMDANGCTYDFNVIINPGAPFANAAIDPAGPYCEDAPPATMTAASSGGTWSGTGITDPMAGTFDPATAGPGTHTITYTIGGSCGATDTEDIIVNPLPVISFTADVTSGCEPLTVTFTNTGASGTCFWDFGDGNTSTVCSPVTHTYANPGVYDVTLTVTDANGCTNSMTMPGYITVYAIPVADFSFGPQPTSVLYPNINFTDQSVDATSWAWDFAGLGSSSAQNPSFSFPDIGSYDVTLTVTSAGGCTHQVTYTVVIGPEFLLYVPNAITADGDGINDWFFPVISGEDPLNYELYIFDRWGELIFEAHNPSIGWDGSYKGVTVQQDVYVWRIIVKDATYGETHEYIGHVTVLK